MLPFPVIVTVPALVSAFSKVVVPAMFSTAPPAMVTGAPAREPPDQLNTAPIVMGLVKLIAPLVKLMASVDPGTPAGVQLFAVNQSLDTEPFQVNVAAEHRAELSRDESDSKGSRMAAMINGAHGVTRPTFLRKSRGSRMAAMICHFVWKGGRGRSVGILLRLPVDSSWT